MIFLNVILAFALVFMYISCCSSDYVTIDLNTVDNAICGSDNGWSPVNLDTLPVLSRGHSKQVLKASSFSCASIVLNVSPGELVVTVYLETIADSRIEVLVRDENEVIHNHIYDNSNIDFERGWHTITLTIDKETTVYVTLLGFSQNEDIVIIESIKYNDSTLAYSKADWTHNKSDIKLLDLLPSNVNNMDSNYKDSEKSSTPTPNNEILDNEEIILKAPNEFASYVNPESDIIQYDSIFSNFYNYDDNMQGKGISLENNDYAEDLYVNDLSYQKKRNIEKVTIRTDTYIKADEEINNLNEDDDDVEENNEGEEGENDQDQGEDNEGDGDSNGGDANEDNGEEEENESNGVDGEEENNGEDGETEDNENNGGDGEEDNGDNGGNGEEDNGGNGEEDNGGDEGDGDEDNGDNGGDGEEDNGGDGEEDNGNNGGDGEEDNGDNGGDGEEDNGDNGGDGEEDNEDNGGDGEEDNGDNGGDGEEDNGDNGGDGEEDNGDNGGDSEEDNGGDSDGEEGNTSETTTAPTTEMTTVVTDSITDSEPTTVGTDPVTDPEPTPAPSTEDDSSSFWNVWTITLVSVASVTLVAMVVVGAYYFGKNSGGNNVVSPIDLDDLEAPRIIPRVTSNKPPYERFGSEFGGSSYNRDY